MQTERKECVKEKKMKLSIVAHTTHDDIQKAGTVLTCQHYFFAVGLLTMRFLKNSPTSLLSVLGLRIMEALFVGGAATVSLPLPVLTANSFFGAGAVAGSASAWISSMRL